MQKNNKILDCDVGIVRQETYTGASVVHVRMRARGDSQMTVRSVSAE